MMLYQAPFISTIRQEPLQAQTQYNPNCFGDACSQNLGVFDVNFDPDEVAVSFFLPGRTDPSAPTNCIVVAQDGNLTLHDGQACAYFQDASCAEGQVWSVQCSYPGNPLDNNGFNAAFISCDGELSSVCSSGGGGE